jgi:hypothetical protein
MKKRKFEDGGFLSKEAKEAGLSEGRNPNIRPEDREAGIAAVERAVNAAKGMSDREANLLMENNLLPADMQTPAGEAEAIPVPAPRRAAAVATPRSVTPRVVAPDMVSDQLSRNVPAPRTAMQNPPARVGGATPRAIPTQNPTLRNAAPIPRNIPSSPDTSSGMTARPSDSMRLRREKEKLRRERPLEAMPMKKGGAVKASKRGDGIAQRGKTKGRML